MLEYKELNLREKAEVLYKAYSYRAAHTKSILESTDGVKAAVPPSGSDLFRPELWKGIHWNWFDKLEDSELP